MKSRFTSLIFFFSLNTSLFSQDAELCSPYALSVFGGNQENVISWAEASNVGCGNYSINEMHTRMLATILAWVIIGMLLLAMERTWRTL